MSLLWFIKYSMLMRVFAHHAAEIPASDEAEIHGDVPRLDPEILRPAPALNGLESLSYLLRRQAD